MAGAVFAMVFPGARQPSLSRLSLVFQTPAGTGILFSWFFMTLLFEDDSRPALAEQDFR